MTVASMLPVWHVQGSILIVRHEDGQNKQYTVPSWFKLDARVRLKTQQRPRHLSGTKGG